MMPAFNKAGFFYQSKFRDSLSFNSYSSFSAASLNTLDLSRSSSVISKVSKTTTI
jgi:hypothetical protein